MVEAAAVLFCYKEIILSSLFSLLLGGADDAARCCSFAVDAFMEEYAGCFSRLHCKNPCHYICDQHNLTAPSRTAGIYGRITKTSSSGERQPTTVPSGNKHIHPSPHPPRRHCVCASRRQLMVNLLKSKTCARLRKGLHLLAQIDEYHAPSVSLSDLPLEVILSIRHSKVFLLWLGV